MTFKARVSVLALAMVALSGAGLGKIKITPRPAEIARGLYRSRAAADVIPGSRSLSGKSLDPGWRHDEFAIGL